MDVTIVTNENNDSKINKLIGWKPKMTFEKLVNKMVDYDLKKLKNI